MYQNQFKNNLLISMAEQSRMIMDCQSKPIEIYKSCLLIILRYPLFTKTMFGSDLKNLVNPRRLVHNTERPKFLFVRYIFSIKNAYTIFPSQRYTKGITTST